MLSRRFVLLRFTIILIVGLVPLACRDRRRSPTTAPESRPGDPGRATANEPRLLGVDGEDDAHAPACLPATQTSGNWVKREPIRVFPSGDLAKSLTAEQAARCAHFRIKSVARCAYALKRSIGTPAMARVVLLEALSADDAYGLLTCMSSSTETYKIGGETRVEHAGGLTLHAWQGRNYARIASDVEDPELTEETIRLLMHICGRIAREDAPAILGMMPVEGRKPGRVWIVRHLASLPPGAIERSEPLDAQRVAAILGLGKDTLVCVAAYDVPQGRRPNSVWIVSYTTVKSAHDAFARYSRLINSGTDAATRNTSILPVQGTYLIGTWTAEEESLSYVLPKISKLLPS